MTTIFDLKTNTEELSSANAGTSRMQYEQHPPTRDVTGTNFANGAIHTRFTVSGSKWWVPARSYMRMRCSLTKADTAGAPGVFNILDGSENLAPNMGLMSNLFQSGEFRIQDKTISRVSDYMAQVDALETRLNKSKSWLDSVGNSVNMWDAKFLDRQNKVIAAGVDNTPDDGARTLVQLGAIRDPLTNTVDYDQVGGVPDRKITVTAGGGTAIPDLTTLDIRAGDTIRWERKFGNALAGSTSTIQFVGATYIQLVANDPGADIGAAVYNPPQFTIIRQSRVNESKSRRIKTFELIWQPPMSIFKIGHALPAGKYELVLNPQTAQIYKQRAIESLGANKIPGTDQDYEFKVDNMYFYTAVVDGNRADDITYLIDLEETRCQVDTATSGGLQQRNFDVSPSTFALTAAFQDEAAGQDTQYSSSRFKVRGDNELSLQRFYMNYAGQNKPAPDADPEFVPGTNTDYTTQRYIESVLHSGSYFDNGGSETIEEWRERGAYYHFNWPRDGTDRSTRVNVNMTLGTPANTRVLLFDHYKAVARVQVQNGHVVDVQLDDA